MNMMPLVYDTTYAGSQQQQPTYTASYPYTYNTAFFDDLSRQLASATSTIQRRHSRSSHYGAPASIRTPGSVMRVGKPRSANNSPQSAASTQARTRNYLSQQQQLLQQQQQQHQQHQQLLQQQQQKIAAAAAAIAPARRARPMSWHPGSTYNMLSTQGMPMATQQQVPAQVAMQMPMQMPLYLSTQFQSPMYTPAATTPSTTAADHDLYSTMQPFSLSPNAYSSQTSPSTAFSPNVGHLDTTAGNYYSPNPWALSPSVDANGVLFDKLPSPVLAVDQQQTQQPVEMAAPLPPAMYQQQQQQPAATAPLYAAQTGLDASGVVASSQLVNWAWFPTHGFDAAPLTPPDHDAASMAAFAAALEVSKPSSNQGLIAGAGAGMNQTLDLQQQTPEEPEGEVLVALGLYDAPDKACVNMTGLFGGMDVQPTGKGLKLEDAWEPPENFNDDNDDDNDDDDEKKDAEGDEDKQ